jgi:two-component system sensor histidine kinase MprB
MSARSAPGRRPLTRVWLRLSLRTRLTVIAAAAVAVAVLAVSAAAGITFSLQLRSAAKDRLSTDAQTILDAAQSAGATQAELPPYPGHGPLVRVILPDGTTRTPSGQDETLPAVTDANLRVARGQLRETFDVVELPKHYLVYTVHTTGGAVQVARDGRFFETSLTTLGLALLVISLVGVVVAAAIGRTVARAGLAPVDRLTAAAVQVARTKDLDAAIAQEGAGEIGRLVQAINDMLAALRSSRQSQRLLAENAAHELGTPLTSLRSNIELLIRLDRNDGRALPEAARARLLEDLGGQVIELSNLVAELTDLARGDISVESAAVLDLSDVVGAAVVRARSRTPGVEWIADLASAPVLGRPAALQRAVLNLLDNAGKWSPPGEPILVRLTNDGRWARLEVDDAGPGIDTADVPRVFDRFYRADSARALPGSGLGLSIVQQVVDGHGGSAGIERSARGGTLVYIRLPVAPAGQPADDSGPALDHEDSQCHEDRREADRPQQRSGHGRRRAAADQ